MVSIVTWQYLKICYDQHFTEKHKNSPPYFAILSGVLVHKMPQALKGTFQQQFVVFQSTAQEAFLGILEVRTLEPGLSIGISNGKSRLQSPGQPESQKCLLGGEMWVALNKSQWVHLS